MSSVRHFHCRGDTVPPDWYEVLPKPPGVPKVGELTFANSAISHILEDGSRVLQHHFCPAISVDGCDNITIRFTPQLAINPLDEELRSDQ